MTTGRFGDLLTRNKGIVTAAITIPAEHSTVTVYVRINMTYSNELYIH